MQSANLLSGLTKKLAERWFATLFTPAVVFWLGGGLMAVQILGWDNAVRTSFNALSESLKVVTIVLVLLGVAVSGFVVQHFDFAILRALEGYWPKWLRPVRRWQLTQQNKYLNQQDQQWQQLQHKRANNSLTHDDAEDLAQIDWQLTRLIPEDTASRMPTKLGNILRTAELAPTQKYGLNAVLCWPHLWMVLPEIARTDLAAAREDLNTAVRIWFWSVLFCLWAVLAIFAKPFYWALWPIPVGLSSAYICYRWALNAAQTYGNLLQAVYDLYRFDLYEALKLTVPKTPEEEKAQAEKLNRYLLRGY